MTPEWFYVAAVTERHLALSLARIADSNALFFPDGSRWSAVQ